METYTPAIESKKQEIENFVEQEFQNSALPSLEEYIRIPNLSPQFDPEWKTNGLLQKAANHIIDWVKSQNLKNLKIQLMQDGQDRPPLIFIEIDGTLNNDNTILFYGHFDKQPHFTGWNEGLGPTTPVIKDGFLYGRGGADDGYSCYGSILAIKACQSQGIPHPRCVLTIEGEEETGSFSYMHYLNLLKDKIGQPNLVICLDSGCLDYKTLWVTTTLRGYIDGTLKVQVTKEGVHSGSGSGYIPSSFRVIRQLLDRLEDSKTGIVHKNFHVDIPPHRYEEAFDVSKQLGDQLHSHFPFHNNTQQVEENNLEGYLNNTWRPTISYIGADGLPPTATAGNVLRPETVLGVSMRTPPTLSSKDKAPQLKQLLEENPPYNSTVTYDLIDAGNGWNAPKYLDFLQKSLENASESFYKNPVRSLGMGGSIPLMNELQELYPKAQFIVTGVLGPNSNAHGPNECLNISYVKKLICCMAQIIGDTQKYNTQFQ